MEIFNEMIKGIIYNEFGQIAQEYNTRDIFDMYRWFEANGVVGYEWANNIKVTGNLYYYHRRQVEDIDNG